MASSSLPPDLPPPEASVAACDPVLDPLAVLDQLIALSESHISAFERQRQTDQLTPRQVELAIIHTITGAIRTTNQLARLLEEAAKAPQRTAFAEAIACFSASITRAEARLRELEAHRRLEQIPWLPRERLQLRHEAVQERLRLAQARLRRRAEVQQERQRQRAGQQPQRARHHVSPDDAWAEELREDARPAELRAPDSARPGPAPHLPPPPEPLEGDMVRIADPYTPTGWRLVPRATAYGPGAGG